tara:strand:+ start:1585 stop:2319 length:735 start_codon:yes stop_codon:yes gene_type:complete
MATKTDLSRWSPTEDDYLTRRTELLEKTDRASYVDHPFVFSRRQTVCSALTRIKLFEQIRNVKGSIVECGVHKGNSMMLFFHLSSTLEPYAFNRKIYGFDSFGGFRSLTDHDQSKADESMFADTDYDTLSEMVQLSDLNRPVNHIPKCEIVRGDATETIPQFVEEHPELIIALLYLDFDIYAPTKVALEHLLPLVPKGGIVAFDELNSAKWKGETIAFKEMLELRKVKLQKFDWDPWPSYFVVE